MPYAICPNLSYYNLWLYMTYDHICIWPYKKRDCLDLGWELRSGHITRTPLVLHYHISYISYMSYTPIPLYPYLSYCLLLSFYLNLLLFYCLLYSILYYCLLYSIHYTLLGASCRETTGPAWARCTKTCWAGVYVCVCVWMCVCVCKCVYVYVCICVCKCLYVYVCVCV
jgi:hypothetical protein